MHHDPIPLVLTQTAPPATEPVTLAEAKVHMRIDDSSEDDFITSLISVARQYAETATDRQFMTATFELRLDDFPHGHRDTIRLPRPTLQAVSSIVYTDGDGVAQTIASTSYQVDVHSQPGRVRPTYGVVWPFVRSDALSPIVITYTAGYGVAADVPQAIKQAIKIMVSDMFENRESFAMGRGEQPFAVPFAAAALLGPFRVMTVY